MKRIAPFNIRRHLCESVVLSKLDYCSGVFDPLTITQQRRLQKIQNSCDALIFNYYCSASDSLSSGWLPIKERAEMKIANLFYQALHIKNFPEYLKLNFAPKNVCYEHAIIMVRWLKFHGTETHSLQKQLICLTNFLKILV